MCSLVIPDCVPWTWRAKELIVTRYQGRPLRMAFHITVRQQQGRLSQPFTTHARSSRDWPPRSLPVSPAESLSASISGGRRGCIAAAARTPLSLIRAVLLSTMNLDTLKPRDSPLLVTRGNEPFTNLMYIFYHELMPFCLVVFPSQLGSVSYQ